MKICASLKQQESCDESGEKPLSPITLDRLAYSPAEFAALFDHAPVWGYRRIYCGDVKVLRQGGRLMIPRGEIENFLSRTVTYNGKQSLSPRATKQSVNDRKYKN